MAGASPDVAPEITIVPPGRRLFTECDQVAAPTVSMTAAEYEHVRSDNDRFAVLPGHEEAAIERVIEQTDRYVIVDKRPEAEPYVGADGEPASGA